MSTSTTRAGLTKPSGSASPEEYVDVTVLNTNADTIDKLLGCILVNNGVTPPDADLIDGALVKEKTSGIIWEARANGSGGFDKVYVRYPCYLVGSTTAQSVATGTTYVAIGYSTFEAGKNASGADLVAGRFVVPIKGLWSINIRASFAANAVGQRALTFEVNSSMKNADITWLETLGTAASLGNAFDSHLHLTRTVEATAGTTLAAGVWQSSGGNLNVSHSAVYTLIEPTQ
jgi:hypothetical protein